MKVHVTNIEPQGYRFPHFLDHLVKLVNYGMEALGHQCSIGQNSLEPNCLNVLVGGHLITRPEDVEKILSSGIQYVVLQSEIIRADGINLLRNSEQLQQVYLPLLHGAIAIWDGSPENIPALAARGIHAESFLGGYHPALEEVVPKNERDIDFFFFGSATPHRRRLIDRIRQRGYNVALQFDSRPMYRNDMIARAKVHLSPGQGDTMDHFPWSRVCYLINNHGLVVVENCRDQDWLEHCFVAAETSQWVDRCIETLERPDRLDLEDLFYQRFRQMPIAEHIERLLEKLPRTAKLSA